MLRSPAVAGQFYPGSEASLLKTLGALVPEIQPADRKEALAVVSPMPGTYIPVVWPVKHLPG